ncbi:hypothetical protein, partial [Xanthomonas oryzae]|uniref:hypothetical protein n=1 Tax=Xanthomonas oryzae TaxID=347 RepID=UPI001C49F260
MPIPSTGRARLAVSAVGLSAALSRRRRFGTWLMRFFSGRHSARRHSKLLATVEKITQSGRAIDRDLQ